MAYALPILAVIGLIRARRSHETSLHVSAPSVATGIVLGVDLMLLHLTIEILGAGLATVLANLQVVVVGLGARYVFGEHLKASFWLSLPLALVGISLIGLRAVSIAEGLPVALGVSAGLASAALYGIFVLLVKWLRVRGRTVRTLDLIGSATVGAFIATGITGLALGVALPPRSISSNLWLLALAAGSQVGGWLLIASAIRHIPAALTGLLLLFHPALAMLWAWVILREPFGTFAVIGSGFVLAGFILAQRGVRA